jgi:hypothetical protein
VSTDDRNRASTPAATAGVAGTALPLRPISLPRLLDQAIQLGRRGPWRPLVSFALVLVATNMVFSVASIGPSLMAMSGGGAALSTSCAMLMLLIVLLPIVMAITVLVYAGLAVSATRRVFGGDESFRASLGELFTGRMLGTIALAALVSCIGFVAGLPLFFLVAPPFIVSALCAFSIPIVLQGNASGMAAISRSFRLVWGREGLPLFGRPLFSVLGLFLVTWIISSLLTLILQLPYQVLVQIASFRQALGGGAGSDLAPLLWLQVPLTAVVSFFSTWPMHFSVLALALLYRDAVERLEATGLEGGIAALERATRVHPEVPSAAPDAGVP